jgi:formylglycine-generating enzyme required for sulfatase activity
MSITCWLGGLEVRMRRILITFSPLFFFVLMAPLIVLPDSCSARDRVVDNGLGKKQEEMKEEPTKSEDSMHGEIKKRDIAEEDAESKLIITRGIVNTVGMKFVYIPPGTFTMGSPHDEPGRDKDERQHQVTLTSGFYMQTTEVTQGQWKTIMGYNPSNFKDCGDDCPVEQVSWNEAQEFVQKLNKFEGVDHYRLPTEAEWEYASRAKKASPFFFGRCLTSDQANFNGNYPLKGCPKGIYRKKPVRVGSFPPNDWGLYDMYGNVWEWCHDWYGEYPLRHVIDPKGPSWGIRRVLRGGRWSLGAKYCRSANRFKDLPGNWVNFLGFRLVRTAEEPPVHGEAPPGIKPNPEAETR